MRSSSKVVRRGTAALIAFIAVAAVIGASGCAQLAPGETPTAAPTEVAEGPEETSTPTPEPLLPEPTVAVSPAEGPPGTEIQALAAGFPPEVEVEVAIGQQGSDPNLVLSGTTDGEGSFSTALAIPSTAEPGQEWVVVVTGEEGAEATSNVFQVTVPEYEPAVSISPDSGPPGTEVELVAQDFPPEAIVEIGVGPENSEYEVVDTMETGPEGSLNSSVAVPGFAEPGARWVVVVVTEDGAYEGVSNVFEVEEVDYQGTVAIAPTSGAPGTEVEVVARGFPPNAPVEIGIGRVDSEYDVVANGQTDGDGRVSTQIVIPSFVEPEDRWVIVVAAENPPVTAVSDEFDVLAVATPTPGGDLFTSTDIYLIAVGDDGQRGQEIGCDDSVVPVEVAIEPTIAPLTAALNRMLSIETRTYADTGLYNVFYQSNLTLDTVRIENGRAVIGLTGALQLGGVCDEPRVRAQLRQTALQYATVDEVSIFINGTPLDQLLGAAPEPTPDDEALFRRTDIYLIAVGDEGELGPEIGCDDSVVPVEVVIDPTIAPLTAALEKLLSLGRPEYGMAGYYNALYQSELTVDDVTIENREATILLSGDLVVGGACDGPRIRAQLEYTALQFATVDRVAVFVNGESLAEVLGVR
jgi:spore germination protein GerM